MKIVYFQIVSEYGGASRCLVELASWLKPYADVRVVDVYGSCKPFGEALDQAGVSRHILLPGQDMHAVGSRGQVLRRLVRLAATIPNVLKVRKAAEALLAQERPDVIISNDFRSALPVALSRRFRHSPLVVYCHGWWTPDMLAAYSRRMARKRCAALIAVSRPTKLALTCAGIDPGKIHVVHNCIDAEKAQAAAAKEFAAPVPQLARPVRLLMPATIIQSKGQHTAIRALGRLVRAGKDAVLWLAGDLTSETQPYVDHCNDLAKGLGVAERVVWLGLRSDVVQLMNASTMVILPSYSEGHPRVTLEAGALGKPFVGTPVGGVTDMILPRITGMLHEIDDDEGMARCILELLENPALCDRIARNASAYIRECFAVDQQMAKVLAVLQKAVTASRP